jgi:4-alpha-glucanotransferase
VSEKRIVFGMFSQKPLGVLTEDLEFSLLHCYKPLLAYLYSQEYVKFSLYISATQLDWIEDRHPEINMLINDMVKRRQLELIAGGFYDPVMTLIPVKDRSQQLELSVTYLRKRFGRRPKTLWLTDQVWSPTLITTCSNCGIQNILIGTSAQGAEPLYTEPFTMQDLGKSVNIYPVLSPFSEDTESDSLLQLPSADTPVLGVMLDLNRLASMMMLSPENELIGEFVGLIEAVDSSGYTYTHARSESERVPAFTRRHLPSGWYRCCSKPEGVREHSELLIRYPEMNQLYGRLCYSQKLTSFITKEKSLKKLINSEILKGESYGAFTHTDWGSGIYLSHIRKENYRHLIEADKFSRERGLFTSSIAPFDFDFDNVLEYIYRGKNVTAVVDSKGGTLTELDYLVTSWNYLDTFLGHPGESVESGYAPGAIDGKQNSFCDLFLPMEMNLQAYRKQDAFSLEKVSYDIQKLARTDKCLYFSLAVEIPFIPGSLILLEKSYTFRTNAIEVEYLLTNRAKKKIHCRFSSEQNISFADDSREYLELAAEDTRHDRPIPEGKAVMANVKKLTARDLHNRTLVTLQADRRFTLVKQPYSTVIQTSFGETDIYQHTLLLPSWEIELLKDEQWRCSLMVRIEKVK